MKNHIVLNFSLNINNKKTLMITWIESKLIKFEKLQYPQIHIIVKSIDSSIYSEFINLCYLTNNNFYSFVVW